MIQTNNRNNESKQKPILVTGATGNVGRHVVSQLLTAGYSIRALTRNPDSANLPREVTLFRGSPSAADILDEALDGVEAVFLIWRGQSAAAAPELVNRFKKHARRIVFLSSSAVRDGVEQQTNPVGWLHAEVERSIQKSGLEWTFLRPGGFATNALAWWAPQIQAGDVVRWPYGRAATSPIHERDIATVAVHALTEDGHTGAKYVLTGPESLTQIDQVHAIGEATGRPLRFEEMPPEAARQEMLALIPAPIVDVLFDFWSKAAGPPALVTTTVADITGSPGRTFREWAIDHASDFQLRSAEVSQVHAGSVR
ncbi:MAG: NAD(P)H-binding protein [Bryobacteraceae bacterium]